MNQRLLALEKKALKGDLVSKEALIDYFFFKKKASRTDYKKAVKWAKEAAKDGSPHGETFLGFNLDHGFTCRRNPKLAFRWYLKAAEKGHPNALSFVAYAYSQGYGTRKNLKKALQFDLQAAAQGDTVSAYNLGQAYNE